MAKIPESELLQRITIDPSIFGGKPIVRGRRLAVEHVIGMLAAGDTPQTLLAAHPWLEHEDVHARFVFVRRAFGGEDPQHRPFGTLGRA